MAFLRSTTIGALFPQHASAAAETFSIASSMLCRTSARTRVMTIPSAVLSMRAALVFRTGVMADHYGCFGEKFNRHAGGHEGPPAVWTRNYFARSVTAEINIRTFAWSEEPATSPFS